MNDIARVSLTTAPEKTIKHEKATKKQRFFVALDTHYLQCCD